MLGFELFDPWCGQSHVPKRQLFMPAADSYADVPLVGCKYNHALHSIHFCQGLCNTLHEHC